MDGQKEEGKKEGRMKGRRKEGKKYTIQILKILGSLLIIGNNWKLSLNFRVSHGNYLINLLKYFF